MLIEQRIGELKAIIARHDGTNAADRRFARAVDEVVGAVYADIGEVSPVPSRALFDLFVIKVLYVGRRSRHADVIEYLGSMLERYLHTRELFPPDASGQPQTVYYGDVLDEERHRDALGDRYEAYRRYGDSALFMSGIFGAGVSRGRPGARSALRRGPSRTVDRAYYVTTGRAMYQAASREERAERERQRPTLERLADGFEVYVDALNEMSERYLLGFDAEAITDRMLDAFNRYRTSRDARDLAEARRYASMLDMPDERVDALFGDPT